MKESRPNVRQLFIRQFQRKKDAIAEGKITTLIRPLQKQPPAGFDHHGKAFNGTDVFSNGGGVYFFPAAVFWPGELMYIRERHAVSTGPNGERFYIYQADHPEDQSTRWIRPPVMPKEAARFFLVVVDTKIKRIQNIDRKEAKAAGIDGRSWKSDLAREWDAGLEEGESTIKYENNPFVQVVHFKRVPRPDWWTTGIRDKKVQPQKLYTITEISTEKVVVTGTAKECAEKMGFTSTRQIYTMAHETQMGKNKKYSVKVHEQSPEKGDQDG